MWISILFLGISQRLLFGPYPTPRESQTVGFSQRLWMDFCRPQEIPAVGFVKRLWMDFNQPQENRKQWDFLRDCGCIFADPKKSQQWDFSEIVDGFNQTPRNRNSGISQRLWMHFADPKKSQTVGFLRDCGWISTNPKKSQQWDFSEIVDGFQPTPRNRNSGISQRLWMHFCRPQEIPTVGFLRDCGWIQPTPRNRNSGICQRLWMHFCRPQENPNSGIFSEIVGWIQPTPRKSQQWDLSEIVDAFCRPQEIPNSGISQRLWMDSTNPKKSQQWDLSEIVDAFFADPQEIPTVGFLRDCGWISTNPKKSQTVGFSQRFVDGFLADPKKIPAVGFLRDCGWIQPTPRNPNSGISQRLWMDSTNPKKSQQWDLSEIVDAFCRPQEIPTVGFLRDCGWIQPTPRNRNSGICQRLWMHFADPKKSQQWDFSEIVDGFNQPQEIPTVGFLRDCGWILRTPRNPSSGISQRSWMNSTNPKKSQQWDFSEIVDGFNQPQEIPTVGFLRDCGWIQPTPRNPNSGISQRLWMHFADPKKSQQWDFSEIVDEFNQPQEIPTVGFLRDCGWIQPTPRNRNSGICQRLWMHFADPKKSQQWDFSEIVDGFNQPQEIATVGFLRDCGCILPTPRNPNSGISQRLWMDSTNPKKSQQWDFSEIVDGFCGPQEIPAVGFLRDRG